MGRELDACQAQLETVRRQMDTRQAPYLALYHLCQQWRDNQDVPPLLREQLGAALGKMGRALDVKTE